MMNQSQRIEFAHSLRGLAALFVLLHHYFIIFWLSRDIPAALINMPVLSYRNHPTPFYVKFINFYPFFDYGAFGVALFFLISGFVIPFSLAKSQPLQFFINRIFRIFPVYILGFTLSLLMLWICGCYFGHDFPYHIKEIFIHYIPGLRDVLHSRAIDGIIWTLEIEMKFYMICLCCYLLLKKYSLNVFWVPIIMGVIALFLNFGFISHAGIQKIIPVLATAVHFIIFMFIGVVFHYRYKKIISLKATWYLISMLFIVFSVLDYDAAHQFNVSLNISYIIALILFSVAFKYPWVFKNNVLFDYLAQVSYPLYVIHGIFGFVLMRILLTLPISADWALAITCLCAFLLATLIHYFIEVPAQRYGKRLQDIIFYNEILHRKDLLTKQA